MKDKTSLGKGKKNSSKLLLQIFIVILIVLIILSGVWYISNSNAAKKDAAVENTPDNCYSETLHAVADYDYKPYSYITEDGSLSGMDVEMITEIANRLHMNLDLELVEWGEAKARIRDGEADVILNMESDSVTEDSGMITTIPCESKEYVVYGHDQVSSIGELFGTRIASMQLFPELGLREEITYFSSYREMFERLDAGEFDYVICPLQVGETYLKDLGLKDIQPSYVVKEMYGCIALRAERAMLRNRINVILKELKQEGFLENIDRKWVVHYQDTSLSNFLISHPLLLLVIVLVVIGLIMLLVFYIKDSKHLRLQEGYNRELQEKIETIARQKEEVETEKRKAEAANSVKSTFLFNMSHDIRTPLNAIIGSAEMARAHMEDSESVRISLERISLAGGDLLQMFNDMLEMANVEDHKVQLEPAVCELPMVIRAVELTMGEQAEQKHQELTVSVENVMVPHVICDALRLRQILRNLLSNAVKFTQEGGHIHLSLRQLEGGSEDSGIYEFRVKDDGCGMAPEYVGKAFQMFERAQTSTQSGQRGAGVGLPVVKSLVDLMGGSIRIDTAPGVGTEVIIQMEFPLYSASQTAGGGSETAEEAGSLVGKKILLVDDIEVNRDITEMILCTMGCSVETAEDGAQAVEMVQNAGAEGYDLILMDIQMPVMDGYEATRAIRALKDQPASVVPIIALTANTLEDDQRRAREAGMDDIVPKPIEADVLHHTMLQHFSGASKS